METTHPPSVCFIMQSEMITHVDSTFSKELPRQRKNGDSLWTASHTYLARTQKAFVLGLIGCEKFIKAPSPALVLLSKICQEFLPAVLNEVPLKLSPVFPTLYFPITWRNSDLLILTFLPSLHARLYCLPCHRGGKEVAHSSCPNPNSITQRETREGASCFLEAFPLQRHKL